MKVYAMLYFTKMVIVFQYLLFEAYLVHSVEVQYVETNIKQALQLSRGVQKSKLKEPLKVKRLSSDKYLRFFRQAVTIDVYFLWV